MTRGCLRPFMDCQILTNFVGVEMNMTYCRYQNTVEDMLDAIEHLSDVDDLSEEEIVARSKFIRLCHAVAENWEREQA